MNDANTGILALIPAFNEQAQISEVIHARAHFCRCWS
jgi:hypothetical protein